MPIWRPECPLCGSILDIAKLKYGLPFPCPFCRKPLHISGFYLWVPTLASFLVCGLLGYLLGFRFPKLLLLVVLFLFPVHVVLMLLLTNILKPKIEEHYPDYFDVKHRF
jgi:hypothetical protein